MNIEIFYIQNINYNYYYSNDAFSNCNSIFSSYNIDNNEDSEINNLRKSWDSDEDKSNKYNYTL